MSNRNKDIGNDTIALNEGEDALILSDERHRTLIQTAMDGFWLVDMQGNLLDVNVSYCQMSGYSEQELLAMTVYDLESSETAKETSAHIQQVISRGEDRFFSQHRRKDGDLFHVEVSVQYRQTNGGHFVCFLRDISDDIAKDKAINEAQTQIALLVNHSPGVIYTCKYDKQGAFVPAFVTPNMKTLMGYSPEDFYAQKDLWASNIHPEDSPRIFKEYDRLFVDGKLLHRYRWRHKDGHYLWVRDELSLLRDENGEPEQIVGVWVNIDEQKAAETELEQHEKSLEKSVEELTKKNLEISKVLKEKEILFKELHHRVKNNMQVVSALLSMQSMKCNNDKVTEELLKGKDRIDSMALVHELLYQTDDMARIDLVKYIDELGQILLESHQGDTGKITISVDGEICYLLADSVVPLGLIFNELITNSFEHGLRDSPEGLIRISCHINEAGSLIVHYSDNGRGLPEEELSGVSDSLGLSLIENLSKQLEAKIKFYNHEGMCFELVTSVQCLTSETS